MPRFSEEFDHPPPSALPTNLTRLTGSVFQKRAPTANPSLVDT